MAMEIMNGISSFKSLYDICSDLITWFKKRRKLQQPSVDDQLAKVHGELAKVVHDVSLIDNTVNVLRLEFSDVSNWVKKQKKKEEDRAKQMFVEDASKVLIALINGISAFKSGNPLEITRGVLDIVSSAAHLVGTPGCGIVIGALCIIIGAFLTESCEPQQPSVIDQLAKFVHGELVHFNKRLQDQKYDGLKRRVSDQKSQLRTMKPGEKLDDPNLWNDYVQFMGELSNRFESPLSFKYEHNLTKDPDVADFVTAVVTYCEAYSCFMVLLLSAKGKFAELGSAYKEDEDAVDRKICCQKEDAKEKLSFLSEEKYLTFLGRLPYEGGKLTKIVALSRNMRGKSLVGAVRGSLDLSEMQDLTQVETAAAKVARQVVKGKVEGHEILPPEGLWNWFWEPRCSIQFINETNFPMKIVSGIVGRSQDGLEFVQDVQPHASFQSGHSDFSTGGYIIIYLNGILNPSTDPPAGQARVLEFALSNNPPAINIQDKTSVEFTRGKDTYCTMGLQHNNQAKTDLFWFENEMHFMARGEMVPLWSGKALWRFVFQAFDPYCDILTALLLFTPWGAKKYFKEWLDMDEFAECLSFLSLTGRRVRVLIPKSRRQERVLARIFFGSARADLGERLWELRSPFGHSFIFV